MYFKALKTEIDLQGKYVQDNISGPKSNKNNHVMSFTVIYFIPRNLYLFRIVPIHLQV